MIDRLEKAYGVHILDDSYYSPSKNRFVKRYKIIAPDGCPWDNNLSYQGLLREIKEHRELFLAMKNTI